MRHAVISLGLTLALFAQTAPNDAVANWFPVHVGDKWIYWHESRDDIGDAGYRDGRIIGGSLQVAIWETEETTTGVWTVPEGTLVGRHVRVSGGSPSPDYQMNAPDHAYLIRGNCLYSTEVGWNPVNHNLTNEFLEEMAAGHLSPDFCFPLLVGTTWGAPHFMDWRSAADAKDWKVAGVDDKRTTFHVTSVSSYLGSGMTAEIWFERGVGIVRDEVIHHGTVDEDRSQLVRFEPAPQK